MPGEQWKRGATEWQHYVGNLIRRRVPFGDYVEIPDRVAGDCGLEGFCRDGNAFQCYAATEPLSVTELTEKQKRKVTQDLGKLEKNRAVLEKLLQPTKIRNWALVVPRWEDKALLTHASTKIQGICSKNLPFVEPGCTANIMTLDDFAVEVQILARAGVGSLSVPVTDPHAASVAEFSVKHDDWLRHLDRKVTTLTAGKQEQATQLFEGFLQMYLRGQNVLDTLRTKYPDIHAGADAAKRSQERKLALHSALHEGSAKASLREVMLNFGGALRNQLPGLDDETVSALTDEAIADWLLRCPMDFQNE
ncbi:hypothetical protein PPGU19_005550 [Paraburkholderia sp. PGU19]|nr:hypothetical protein PPGU19_005550 [Paraburkholderia sp. PGU19]